MKIVDVRLPKWRREVWIAVSLVALLVVAIFLPLAFRTSQGEYNALNVGERASCFSDWYQSSGNVESVLLTKLSQKTKQSADSAVDGVLADLFPDQYVHLEQEGSEFLELQMEKGAMRFVHVWGFLTGSYSGSIDLAVDIDTGKILSVSFQVIPSAGVNMQTVNSDSILRWAEEHYDFALLANVPDEEGMSGSASFEYKGSIVSISYSCAYDAEGYEAVSVCCI